MAYYRKLMAQVQAQLQTMWPQLMEQLQQERAARLGAQEAAAHTQAALQVSRLEGEQNALRIAELEAGLRESQLLAQQHQERAEASQKGGAVLPDDVHHRHQAGGDVQRGGEGVPGPRAADTPGDGGPPT
eukprot:TRINITY_DN3357_c0_g1_i2.p4 TRINITY_DN3357_c0_g1~~TRINITY_DN3357_c0_g1_i2.p4  ORF type:complete len:130 (-),score=29.17 TRINITY_DN3357_c0_g1_i2:419-808(-)